jgi:ABC-type multidrug transport system fused ATPase/permease subunit
LNPGTRRGIPLFPKMPPQYQFDLMKIVPSHFHNAWTVVAFALIASTVLKGICDYAGTYLVNYAGYGMITDLRNHLYETIMKSSASFFHKHATGTILSTLINDVERVQTAVSRCWASFCSRFSPSSLRIAVVISWAAAELGAAAFCAGGHHLGAQDRRVGADADAHGQDRVAEIQNILHETITGNRIVKAFSTEIWEILRFKKAARALPRQSALGARAVDQLAADGRDRLDRHCAAALGRPQRDQGWADGYGDVCRLHHRALQAVRSGPQVRLLLQQLSAGHGRIGFDLQLPGYRGRCARKAAPAYAQAVRQDRV